MFVQSRVLPASILTALEPSPGADSLVIALEVSSESWTDGNVGSFRMLDLCVGLDLVLLRPATPADDPLSPASPERLSKTRPRRLLSRCGQTRSRAITVSPVCASLLPRCD